MAMVTALVISLVVGPWIIRKLRERQIGETSARTPPSATDEGRHADDGRAR